MEISWTEMVHYQQQVQKIIRALLPYGKSSLTASECEIMALIYLNEEKNTPVRLSCRSGMKKEAVSRCIRNLMEKGCIYKEKQQNDERSYIIYPTEKGIEELKRSYESVLQPFYDMWRTSGSEFENFVKAADRLADNIDGSGGDRENGVL